MTPFAITPSFPQTILVVTLYTDEHGARPSAADGESSGLPMSGLRQGS
jgi:hypothetical protein